MYNHYVSLTLYDGTSIMRKQTNNFTKITCKRDRSILTGKTMAVLS